METQHSKNNLREFQSSITIPTHNIQIPTEYHQRHITRAKDGVIQLWRVLLWRALVWRVSLWRVSLWRDSSSASFSLARFQFGAFLFGALPCRRVSLWRVSHFCAKLRWSSICERRFRADYLCACFLSAEKSCLPLFARVAYLLCAHVSFRSSVGLSILRACFLSAMKCFLRQFGT